MGNRKFQGNSGENLDYPRENCEKSSVNWENSEINLEKNPKSVEGKVGGGKDTPQTTY